MKSHKSIDEQISQSFALDLQEMKEAGALGYMARALVLATMPHSKPKENSFVRKNGAFSLAMMAHPDEGLPYGAIPRLLLAFLTTEAVKTKQAEIVLGDSLSGFMRELGIVPSGGRWGSVTRLKTQMRKLFSCSVSCRYSDAEGWLGIKNITPVKEATLWWEPKKPEQISLFESTVRLDQDFFNEITAAPVVYRTDSLKQLKQSAMAIDAYIWATYRNSYAKHNSFIPWEALQLQFGAGYPMTARGKQDFKRNFLLALKKVAAVYPDAGKLRDEGSTLLFVPGRPHVPKIYRTIEHGGCE